MLLPALTLLLDLLLLLQLLGDAGLAQGLPLAALVGLGVEGRLKGRVPPHAHHHLLPQLREKRRNWDGYTLVRSTQHAQLQCKLGRTLLLPHGALQNARSTNTCVEDAGEVSKAGAGRRHCFWTPSSRPSDTRRSPALPSLSHQQYFLQVIQEFSTLR